MLYLGNFSFDEPAHDQCGAAHGIFTVLVEAHGVDQALETLRTAVENLKSDGGILDDVERVYLDTCVEVRSVPVRGLMTYSVKWMHPEEEAISTGLHGVENDEAVAYDMVPEDVQDEESYEIEPFVDFTVKG